MAPSCSFCEFAALLRASPCLLWVRHRMWYSEGAVDYTRIVRALSAHCSCRHTLHNVLITYPLHTTRRTVGQ